MFKKRFLLFNVVPDLKVGRFCIQQALLERRISKYLINKIKKMHI